MPSARTINIALNETVPQVRTLSFLPDDVAVGEGLAPSYDATTDSSGVATTDLYLRATGVTRYEYQVPDTTEVRRFYLLPGATAADLDELTAIGAVLNDKIVQFIEEAIAAL